MTPHIDDYITYMTSSRRVVRHITAVYNNHIFCRDILLSHELYHINLPLNPKIDELYPTLDNIKSVYPELFI